MRDTNASASMSPSSLAANTRRALVSILSPAKQTALIECFNNSGLYKQSGSWRGSPDSISVCGVTVADLSRDGMLTVTTNQRLGSAELTERGDWFARTLVKATEPTDARP